MNFIDRLQTLMKEQSLTAYKLSKELSISESLFSKWQKNPEIDPSSTVLKKLSEYFQVSMEWLLTGTDNSFPSSIPMSPTIATTENEEKEARLLRLLVNNFNGLSEKGQDTLVNSSAVLLEKEKEYQQQLSIARRSAQPKKTIRKEIMAAEEPEEAIIIEMFIFDQAASAGLGNYLYEDSSYEMMSFNEDDIPSKTSFGVKISGDSMEPEISHGDIVWVEERVQIENGQIGIFILDGQAYCKKLKIDHDNRSVYLVSLNPNYDPIKVNPALLKTVGRVLL